MNHALRLGFWALLLSCEGSDLEPWHGRVVFTPAPVVAGITLQEADEAAAFLRRVTPLRSWLPGSEPALGYVAVLRRPALGMQVGVTITEIGDEQKRVVFADEFDAEPAQRVMAGVLRSPPGADWPRPCRTYLVSLANPLGELAQGRIVLGGCARAIEDLRGRILFHLGRGGPSLYDFAGSLTAYRRVLQSRRVLVAPRRRAFFLGWKAAFRRPAGGPEIRARLRELATRRVVDEQVHRVDPSWDTLAGGWEVPPEARWPKPGHTYRLTVRQGKDILARGEVVVAKR